MSATYEHYYHEFLSCWPEPSWEQAQKLMLALRPVISPEEQWGWLDVFPVHEGKVLWTAPEYENLTPPSGVSYMLRQAYGVSELPDLGNETGYLIRKEDQGRVACYGYKEIPRGEPTPEVKVAREFSLGNYNALRDHLLALRKLTPWHDGLRL